MRDRLGKLAAVHGDQVRHHPAAECALVDEAQYRSVIEGRGDTQMLRPGDRPDEHLSAHSQVHHQGLGAARTFQGQPQVLSPPAGAADLLSGK